jgi:hypothetical protein
MPEITRSCGKCGALISVEYRHVDGVTVFESRNDVKVGLIHKPAASNGTPACGGCIAVPSTPIGQESLSRYIEGHKEHLPETIYPEEDEWIDLLTEYHILPTRYNVFVRARRSEKSLGEIAAQSGVSKPFVWRTLKRGDERLRLIEIMNGIRDGILACHNLSRPECRKPTTHARKLPENYETFRLLRDAGLTLRTIGAICERHCSRVCVVLQRGDKLLSQALTASDTGKG